MGKDIISRLSRYPRESSLLALLVYSILIALSPDIALKLGGAFLWVYLLVRWLRYGL